MNTSEKLGSLTLSSPFILTPLLQRLVSNVTASSSRPQVESPLSLHRQHRFLFQGHFAISHPFLMAHGYHIYNCYPIKPTRRRSQIAAVASTLICFPAPLSWSSFAVSARTKRSPNHPLPLPQTSNNIFTIFVVSLFMFKEACVLITAEVCLPAGSGWQLHQSSCVFMSSAPWCGINMIITGEKQDPSWCQDSLELRKFPLPLWLNRASFRMWTRSVCLLKPWSWRRCVASSKKSFLHFQDTLSPCFLFLYLLHTLTHPNTHTVLT